MSEQHLIVVAIDFGTSYSGFAYQMLNDFKKDPLRVNAPTWYYGESSLVTNKTNTSILFKPDKTFYSFGYEAERDYSSLCTNSLADFKDENFQDWYFFRTFKMQLYRKDTASINSAMEIKDFNGKRMKAMDVFSAAILHLKNQALLEITDTRKGILHENDLKWVVTVPAIWTDPAKQFVRNACEKAGIKNEKLSLALEPEVAAIFCKEYLANMEQDKSFRLAPFDAGSSFMVLDLGGGTADITLHKIDKDNKLKELHKASGGNWGGENVDNAFLDLWIKVVGKEEYKQIVRKFPDEILELRTSFQSIKRQIKAGQNSYLFTLPRCIREVQDLQTKVQNVFGNDVSLTRDKANMSRSCIEKMFDAPVSKLIDHLKGLEETVVDKVDNILLVGGFADSSLVKERIKQAFPNKSLIVPTECNLAVLKGATMFGFDSSCIARRISRYSYGVSSSKPFDEDRDPIHHRHYVDREARCEDLFDAFIKAGDIIYPGITQIKKNCRTVSKAGMASIAIYCSRKSDQQFVIGTEEEISECKLMGSIDIDLSNEQSEKRKNRLFEVTMLFLYSEINVKIVDVKTKEEKTANLNLLK